MVISMKKYIKLLLKGIGNLLHAFLNFPLLIFISDAFVNAKINQKSALKLDGETLYLATPNFLNRYRHKTFFSKEPRTISLTLVPGFEDYQKIYPTSR